MSYWPEGMTWRDYADACPVCDGPTSHCGWDRFDRCDNATDDDEPQPYWAQVFDLACMAVAITVAVVVLAVLVTGATL
jgi:hypothetical protein